jgi:hypothetical protein
MGLFSWLGSNLSPYLSVERDRQGQFFYTIHDGSANFKTQNPNKLYENSFALRKAVSILKDTGKLANINLYENGKLKQNNFLYSLKPKPNPYQTWTNFIEEFIYWYSLGTVYYWKGSGISYESRNQYFLDFSKFDSDTIKKLEKFGKKLTNSNINEFYKDFKNHQIKYKFNDSDTQLIPLSEVVVIQSDINVNSWFFNFNRLNAISKILTNADDSLDAKNINIHFSKKYAAYQGVNKDDLAQQITGLSKGERDDIKQKVMSKDPLHVSGSNNLEIKRFIDNLKNLGYDESFLNDYLLVGLFFNIPLEILGDFLRSKGLSSQGDAKEKAMIQLIDMAIMPILQTFTDVLELGLKENQEVKAEFTHLWFMKVAIKQQAEQRKMDLEALKMAKELGLDDTKVQEQLNIIYNG